jgi:hypothetical protein
MTFVENAETGQFLYLIMFILSCSLVLNYKRCWTWSPFCCSHKATRLFYFQKYSLMCEHQYFDNDV